MDVALKHNLKFSQWKLYQNELLTAVINYYKILH